MAGRGRPSGQPNPTDDAALCRAVRASDTSAFDVLYRRYEGRARQIARSVGPLDDIDDVVADVFADLFEELRAGARPGDLPAHLASAITVRAGRAGQTPVLTDATARALVTGSAEEMLLAGHDRELVRRAAGRLTEADQEVLRLVDEEQRSYADAATALGIPESTLPGQLRRARSRLAEAWVAEHVAEAPADGRHAATEDLVRLASGRMWTSVRARLRGHLRDCVTCTERYEEVRHQRRGLRALVLFPLLLARRLGDAAYDALRLDEHRHRLVPRWTARVALVVLVVGVTAVVLSTHLAPDPDRDQGSQAQDAVSGQDDSRDPDQDPDLDPDQDPGSDADLDPDQDPAVTGLPTGEPSGGSTSAKDLLPFGAGTASAAGGATGAPSSGGLSQTADLIELPAAVAWGVSGSLSDAGIGEVRLLPFSITVDSTDVSTVNLTVEISDALEIDVPGRTCVICDGELLCPDVELGPSHTITGSIRARVLDPSSAALPELSVSTER